MKENKHLLISEETPWGKVEVWEDGSVRSLYMQDKIAIQSKLDMEQKEKLLLQHSQAMMSFLLFQPRPQSILLFGLGGGSIIHFLSHWFPDLKITAVDVNQIISEIAKKYFAISKIPHLTIEVADAFTYLTQTKQKNINVILVDVHDGKSLPDFLYDHNFMAQCSRALSPGGVLVINLLVSNDQDFLTIMKALRRYFTGISLCMTFKKQQNILLFAFKSPYMLELDQLNIKASQCQQKYDIEFEKFINNIVKIEAKK